MNNRVVQDSQGCLIEHTSADLYPSMPLEGTLLDSQAELCGEARSSQEMECHQGAGEAVLLISVDESCRSLSRPKDLLSFLKRAIAFFSPGLEFDGAVHPMKGRPLESVLHQDEEYPSLQDDNSISQSHGFDRPIPVALFMGDVGALHGSSCEVDPELRTAYSPPKMVSPQRAMLQARWGLARHGVSRGRGLRT